MLALVASIRPCHAAPDEVESPRVAEPAPTADPDLDERAQRHWGSGMAYLDEGDYPRALDAFTKAYELSGRARILLAIAVTHERRGDLQSAVETLEEYLRLSPTAPNAPSIEAHRDELRLKHAAELERIRAAKQSEGQAPSPDDVDETNGARESPSKERLPGSGHDRSPRASTLEWTALGIGVASGVAAAVSGVMAWQKREEVAEGCGATRSCSRDATQPGRTMAWVSTALTGVSVVGLGLGIWLALDGPNGADDSKLTAGSGFTVDVNYSPRALTSEVTWSF